MVLFEEKEISISAAAKCFALFDQLEAGCRDLLDHDFSGHTVSRPKIGNVPGRESVIRGEVDNRHQTSRLQGSPKLLQQLAGLFKVVIDQAQEKAITAVGWKSRLIVRDQESIEVVCFLSIRSFPDLFHFAGIHFGGYNAPFRADASSKIDAPLTFSGAHVGHDESRPKLKQVGHLFLFGRRGQSTRRGKQEEKQYFSYEPV